MCKIGILTFHYSNNYGGVLQALSLQKAIESLGFDVEIINFIPSYYSKTKIFNNLGLRKNTLNTNRKMRNLVKLIKKIYIMNKFSNRLTKKFDQYRAKEMRLSKRVDEKSIPTILCDYQIIIVGSDQVWNPSQRKGKEYFLDFGNSFKFKKLSYAADSTTSMVAVEDMDVLKNALNSFSYISVRNKHSQKFVKSIIGQHVDIVSDPTIICDLYDLYDSKRNRDSTIGVQEYILTYILGEEVAGTHGKVIKKIKEEYGDVAVYAITIPTSYFELSSYADYIFYDLGPDEWLHMFENAKFIYTDSFHGVLFSLKYHKPFLAYYTEAIRSTRLIDLGQRYNLDRYIVKDAIEIDSKRSITVKIDFEEIDKKINEQKNYSLKVLLEALVEALPMQL